MSMDLVNRQLVALDGVYEQVAATIGDHARQLKQVREIEQSPTWSDSYKRELIENQRAAAEQATAQRLDAIEATARAHLGHLDTHGRAPIDRGTDAAVYEMREGRAAARVLRQLDAGVDARKLISDAEAAGDELTLVALRAELPATGDTGSAGRIDVALARLGGEHASRARARALVGPLTARLDAELHSGRQGLAAGSRSDMGSAVVRQQLAAEAGAVRATLDAPAGSPVGGPGLAA